jgi:hypothetical protein
LGKKRLKLFEQKKLNQSYNLFKPIKPNRTRQSDNPRTEKTEHKTVRNRFRGFGLNPNRTDAILTMNCVIFYQYHVSVSYRIRFRVYIVLHGYIVKLSIHKHLPNPKEKCYMDDKFSSTNGTTHPISFF